MPNKTIKEKINLCACGVSFPHYHRDCDGLKNPIPIEKPPQIKEDWERDTARAVGHIIALFTMGKITKTIKVLDYLLAQARQKERQKMAEEILKEIEHITELYTKNDFNLDREILAHLYRAIKKVTNR